MTVNDADRRYELEESAQGADLYRAPGSDLVEEDAREQAEASGWVPGEDLTSAKTPVSRAEEHHKSVRESIDQLEQIIARPAGTPNWHQAVAAALDEFGVSLRGHVADVESPGGLFDEITEEAPRLTAEVGEVRKEHETILRTVDQARAAVRDSDQVGVDLIRRRVTGLLGRLVLHRHRVADLLYEAYNVDISAAD